MTLIEPLRPDDWTDAMLLALARVADAERPAQAARLATLLRDGPLDPRGVFVARNGGALIGVQVCVPLPGATCLFWLPVGPDEITDALVQAGLDWCRSLGCKVAQTMVHADEARWLEPLIRRGFRSVTYLTQMGHDLIELPEKTPPRLRFDPYDPWVHDTFSETLERTYDGTLDCPELNGTRTMDEIIAGHRGQGKYDPDFWWLVRDGVEPVGVVILAEMPDGVTWELAYVGVVPAHRRRGLGRAMVVHAMHVLSALPVTRMSLAVDARNRSALALYRSLGFIEVASSEVLLYFFR